MKISFAVVLVGLFLLAFSTTDGHPIAWFARIAAALGVKLAKNSYYARCNTRLVPSGMNCPSVVYGVGLSRGSAQQAAKFYASSVGDSGCARYVGHCQIKKFIK
ncbi:uncharacterized protein LOC130625733 isoform X2 [Hydractinia symbiolongicarpus]|nr:uncharacterized protein LOC130625733 isoform X2 [Hydractinia symbiolongicarpus]